MLFHSILRSSGLRDWVPLLHQTCMSKIYQRSCKPIREKGRIEPILRYGWEAKHLGNHSNAKKTKKGCYSMPFSKHKVSDTLRRLVSQQIEATRQIMILLAAELNNKCVITKQGNVWRRLTIQNNSSMRHKGLVSCQKELSWSKTKASPWSF